MPAPPPKRTVSLYGELTAIQAALEAHHMLLREGRQRCIDACDDEFYASTLLSRASYSIGLIVERVHLLKSAIVGSVDPLLLWTPGETGNAGKWRPGDDPDILLPVWTPKQRAEYARRELRLVHQDEATATPGRRPRRRRRAKVKAMSKAKTTVAVPS